MADLLPFQTQAPDFSASDPYRVLGLARTATPVEIKKTYFGMIRRHTPEDDPQTFKIIRQAYEKLKDAARRKEIDIFLPKPPPPFDLPETMPTVESKLYSQDLIRVLRQWGELGQTDFTADFREIKL